MSILDLDEFLYSPYDINVKNILVKCDIFSQIIVSWVHFGSNGHITQPKSVVKGFTMRALYGKNKAYYSCKSIFKTNNFISFGVHVNTMNNHNYINLSISSEQAENPYLLINHYAIQSLDFFTNVKGTRGDINNYINPNSTIQRDATYFKNYDDNDVLDTRLYEQNKEIIE